MKIGVLSDIHGNADALRVVLDAFRRLNIRQLLFLGDLVGYYPFAGECLAMLAEFEIVSVRGNHDQTALDCLETGNPPSTAYTQDYGHALERALAEQNDELNRFLSALPLTRRVELGGRVLELVHGSPWDALEGRVYPDFRDWNRFDETRADALLFGHTHYPLVHQHGSLLLLNPGAVGQSRHRSGMACAAVLDLEELAATLIELPYDCERLIADSRRHDPGLPYLVEVLTR